MKLNLLQKVLEFQKFKNALNKLLQLNREDFIRIKSIKKNREINIYIPANVIKARKSKYN